MKENPRVGGFGDQTILQHEIMTVPDARGDPRFSDNSLVTSEPWVRFYAGVPVRVESGEALGVLCVLDKKPRHLFADQLEGLRLLARQTAFVLELLCRTLEQNDTRSEAGSKETSPLSLAERSVRAVIEALPLQFCVLDKNGLIVLSSIIDITERIVANDKLKQALNEKEILLKEVYHRVKNNLQVVSSMINLQARNVKHDLARDLLQQSADRVKSMALLHEKLYQSKDLTRIDFKAYVHSLVGYLMFGYGDSPARIQIGLQIEDVFLDVDTAIPCGLIINELLSNALKHAFPDNLAGRVDISFRHDQNECVLEIADNGIGFPPGLDFKKSSLLGLQLVTTLTNQLLGRITLDRNQGSVFAIRFDENSGH